VTTCYLNRDNKEILHNGNLKELRLKYVEFMLNFIVLCKHVTSVNEPITTQTKFHTQ